MGKLMCILVFLYFVTSPGAVSEKLSKEAPHNSLLELYESELQSSRSAESSARYLARTTAQAYSADAVRLLADFRVRAKELKEKTLIEYQDGGSEECVENVARAVEEASTIFLESEKPCSALAARSTNRGRSQLHQAAKEVRKWRQGLVFMGRICRDAHPDDRPPAVECMNRLVDAEHYDAVINRLVHTLTQAQNDFIQQTEESSIQLQKCLDDSFALFSESVARVVENVTLCREEKFAESTAAPAPIPLRKRFKCAIFGN